MFRSICRELSKKSQFIHMPKCNSTKVEGFKRAAEINQVKLIGTVTQDLWRLRNGSLQFYLKTVNPNQSFQVHRVIILNGNLLSIIKNQLALNQRIYVGGKLLSTNFMTEEKKVREEIEIMANELYFLDNHNENSSTNIDENSIELLAFIRSGVKNYPNFSVISVATHFTKRKQSASETEAADFHKIIVQKPYLLNVARELRLYDQIYLNESISYVNEKDENGKTKVHGFIEPTNLVKLKRNEQLKEEHVNEI